MSDRKVSRRKFIKLSLFAGSVGTLGYQLPAKDRISVVRQTLSLPRWNADGFKMAFVSDFHIDDDAASDRSMEAVRLATAEKPDVIAFGGDLVSGGSQLTSFPLVERVFEFIANTNIPCVGVPGNHDYWQTGDRVRKLFETVTKFGMQLLRNETFEMNGVLIYGVDDGCQRMDRHDRFRPSIDKNIVTLFHEPDFVSRIDARASLMIAGHSHGGQICLPFGIKVHTPVGAQQYWSGYYPDARVPLYVSRGVGTVGPDLRTFCPPEVSVLTLIGA